MPAYHHILGTSTCKTRGVSFASRAHLPRQSSCPQRVISPSPWVLMPASRNLREGLDSALSHCLLPVLAMDLLDCQGLDCRRVDAPDSNCTHAHTQSLLCTVGRPQLVMLCTLEAADLRAICQQQLHAARPSRPVPTCITIRVRTGPVEGADATGFAEKVLSKASIELHMKKKESTGRECI